MIVQIFITLIFMSKVFHIQIGFSLWKMFIVLILFGLISVGLSLAIVAFSKSSAGAGALENLIIVPTCLLSGCFFPVDIMPDAVRKIADFMPQRWLLDTITKLQDGKLFSHLFMNYLILIAFAVAFFFIAVYKFSRQNNVQNYV